MLDNKVSKLFLLYVLMIISTLYGTGIVSDDFSFIQEGNKFTCFFDSIIHGNNYLARPAFKYLFSIYYYFVDIDQFVLIEILKIVQIILIFYMTTRFFSMFMNVSSSMIVSFLFIFFPTHDSTIYFYLEVSLTICIAFYLYSYYLVCNNRLISAGFFASLASFVSYGSPPVAFSLFILCILKKSYKKGFILLIPNLIYFIYFVVVTKVIVANDVQRLPAKLNFSSLVKQFILQAGTFIDAIIGPSFFLKLYYSILANNIFSIVIVVLFVVGVYFIITRPKEQEGKRVPIDGKLVIFLIVLTFASLGMFALTGYYPQMAFNLGNRTTIYGSLLVSYLIVSVPIPENIRRIVLLVFLVAIVGLSSHWKQWNKQQMFVIDNIRNNPKLASYNNVEPIYVSGNQYSKLGPFSNIEFLTAGWVTRDIFRLAGHDKLTALTLNKRNVWKNGSIIDKKFNFKYATGKTVMVYDSEADELLKIPAENLNSYIENLPAEKRHWIQFIDNKTINYLLLKLMPRLKYAF